MKFLQKGLEYNRLAKALGDAFVALNAYDAKFNSGLRNDYYEFKQDLLILAYLCRKEILDRLEEYHWAMASPISVTKISPGKITLLFAYQQTIGRLIKYADRINSSKEIQEILDKKTSYQVMKSITPDTIKFSNALLGLAMMRYRYKGLISMMLKNNGGIKKETEDFIVVQNSNMFLKIIKENNSVDVSLTTLNLTRKNNVKEWSFNKDADDTEILNKIFTSFL